MFILIIISECASANVKAEGDVLISVSEEATDSDICQSHSTDGYFWKITFISKNV